MSCLLSAPIPQHISLLLNKTRPTHWKTFKKEEEEKGEGEEEKGEKGKGEKGEKGKEEKGEKGKEETGEKEME